jgi:sugar/nucleoside kinase (ribokinase family)
VHRVLIVGDVIDDIVVTPLDRITYDSDTTSHIRHTPGGSAANQAAWLGSAGVAVRFVARVGATDVERHLDELERFGVEAVLIPDPEEHTGSIVVMLDGDGNRTMYTDRGANLRLTVADVSPSLLDGIDVLHVNGYALFSDGPRAAVVNLIEESRRRDIEITVDPCSAAYLGALGVGAFLADTRGAAVCLPNLDEGRVLTGLVEPRDVVAALAEYYPVVALKLGSGGVLAGAGGQAHLIPSGASSVVDPTGAGDAFCAGFLAAWLDKRSVSESARRGSALAAQAVATPGGRPPI